MMKKLLSLFAAVVVCLCANAKDVPYIVGATDFSTPYLTAYSDVITISDGETAYFDFMNYKTGNNNWEDFYVYVSQGGNDIVRLRADNWENVAGNGNNIKSTSPYNWDGFNTNMNGAKVSTAVTYTNGKVYITNNIIGKDGQFFEYCYRKDNVTGASVDVKLSVEKSYLTVTHQGKNAPVYYPTYGSTDLNNGWWTNFSGRYDLVKGKSVRFQFYSYSDKVEAWHNWVMIGKYYDGWNLTELFGIRADNWNTTASSNANFSNNFDWGTIKEDMDGAFVDMTCSLGNTGFKMDAKIYTKDGKTYDYSYTRTDISYQEVISLFFTGEYNYVSGELAFSESVAPVIPTINGTPVKAAKASYTRTVANNWGTLVLPFDLAYDADNEDVDVFALTDAAISGDEGRLTFTEYESGKIPAGTPVAFKRLNENTTVTWTAEQTPLVTEATTTAPVNGFTMNGTFASKENQTGIYFIAQNLFWYAEDPITIAPFRSWVDAPAQAKTLKIYEEGEATKIESVSASANNSGIFNLAGQRVQNTNTPGIYIINGKKVCVK